MGGVCGDHNLPALGDGGISPAARPCAFGAGPRRAPDGRVQAMSVAPTVSVIVPARNAARWLADTIDSVLVQTFADFELLVVDDASTDETAAVAGAVRDPRLHLIVLPRNVGAAGARNAGIEAARGEFLAFLDADDLALPDRLERQVAFLRRHPEIGLCGGWVKTFGARDEVWTAHPRHEQIKAELLFRSSLMQSAIMCRRDEMRAHGLAYDASIALSEDFELWTRCAEVMRLANIQDVLVRYRIHGDNISIRANERRLGFNRLIRRRQLARLGLEPTAEEEALHHSLAEYGPTGPARRAFDLNAVERWLLRLRDGNGLSGYVGEEALGVLLYEYWRRCCIGSGEALSRAMGRFFNSAVVADAPINWRLADVMRMLTRRTLYPLPRL